MDERPKIHAPRSVGIREVAAEIEEHNRSGFAVIPKTHDDFGGTRRLAGRHHKSYHEQ